MAAAHVGSSLALGARLENIEMAENIVSRASRCGFQPVSAKKIRPEVTDKFPPGDWWHGRVGSMEAWFFIGVDLEYVLVLSMVGEKIDSAQSPCLCSVRNALGCIPGDIPWGDRFLTKFLTLLGCPGSPDEAEYFAALGACAVKFTGGETN